MIFFYKKAQIVMLSDNSWTHDGNNGIPYYLYFAGPGVSTISSIALVALIVFGVHTIRGDRVFALLNAALMIAVVVTNTLLTNYVPWTPDHGYPLSGKGFQAHCPSSDTVMKNRCWLSNGMWIGSIVVAAFWLVHLIYVFTQQRSDIFDDDDDYELYDYRNQGDIAMAVTSHSPVMNPSPKISSPMTPPHGGGGAVAGKGGMMNDYDYSYYEQPYTPYAQTPYGYGGGQQAVDHHNMYNAPPPPHMDAYDAYGGPVYPPPSATMTPTSTTTADDTTHILKDMGSTPHTPIKQHQVPHTYDS
ncbi:hypothetical protein BC940DRAFT_305460 [Gongronella butleri]|nr:hypothetical protein BC940DRAFT_305460 [Gongronella butleri]